MSNLNKRLFVIFGTSRGLGKALYDHAIEYRNNDFLVVNRKKTRHFKRTKELIIDLSKQLKTSDIDKIINVSANEKYDERYFIYNSSTINPLKPIGIGKADEYVTAFYVNVINNIIFVDAIVKKPKCSSNKRVRILNISSGASASPHYGLATYCSTKSALEMFTRCVFLEQEIKGVIQIAALRPGIVNTAMQEQMRSSPLKYFQEATVYASFYKNGKLLDPQTVAKRIYRNIITDQFWTKPVTDIKELK